MGLEKPATVAMVDGNTGKAMPTASSAIAFRNIQQLLGKNYGLLNRQRLKESIGCRQQIKDK